MAHLGAHARCPGTIKIPAHRARLKFESRSRELLPRGRQSFALPDPAVLELTPSYPEGNFGGNQLPDGSISLSPLYPSLTNDLHVSSATDLHQSFLWLRPAQA
jgi:hypothetical protein